MAKNAQSMMFDTREETDTKYTSKIAAPKYEPSHEKPPILSLVDLTETERLIREVDSSSLPENEKRFLRAAAWRHAVFNYERIADYYAHSSPEAQRLFESSVLVLVDFDDAIESGFVRLCDEIKGQFLEEYPSGE